MTKEYLKSLGLDDSAAESVLAAHNQAVEAEKQKAETAKADAQGQIAAVQAELDALKASSGNVSALQQKYDELKAKYDADTADLNAKLADRDYMDGMKAAVAGKALKFSSKAAERDFMAQLKEKKLELKDGVLSGLDDFITAYREADQTAFASDKPVPHFMGPVGAGGQPPEPTPANVALAKSLGAARAATM